MNGIIINIEPVIFRIGGFELRWYSVAIIGAVVVGMFVAAREGKRKGLPANFIYSLTPWLVVAGLLGARMFHVLDQWEYYAGDPFYIFQFQQGGLVIWGGLFGGGVAAVVYARMRRIPLGRLADTGGPALLTGQIIGRLGCIINGDAAGGVTSLPWGFIYTHPDALISDALFDLPTHPYPVYEMLWNGATLLALLKLRHRFRKEWLLFFSYLSLYSVGRFALTFVRQGNVLFWQLQQAQVVAIGVLVVSVGALIYLAGKGGAGNNSGRQGAYAFEDVTN